MTLRHSLWFAAAVSISSGLLSGCTNSTAKDKVSYAVNAPQVPELLERNSELKGAEEFERWSEAYANAKRAIEQNANNLDSWLQLAQVFVLEARVTGKYGYYYDCAFDAIDCVLNSEATNEQRFEALTLKATVLLSEHKFKKALEVGKEALALNDKNASVYGILVDAHVELGNYKKAAELCDKMNAIRPDIRSYSRASYIQEIHGIIDGDNGAIAFMKLAVAAGAPGQEETAWARHTLGTLYETYGDLNNAEVQYLLALEERPNYPFAMADIGRLELKKKNYAKAEEWVHGALAIMEDAGFHELLAMIHKEKGESEKEKDAVKSIFRALGSDADHGHSHANGLEAARAHLMFTGNHAEGIHMAEHEWLRRSDNIDVNRMLAALHYKRGDITKASEHLENAQATNSKNPELLCLAGLIAVANGDEAEGKGVIKEAFEANPFMVGVIAEEGRAAL